jgi:hypothetical protein
MAGSAGLMVISAELMVKPVECSGKQEAESWKLQARGSRR